MAMHEDDVERVCRQGTQAWQRLKKDKNWSDWIKVGEAHLVGREWAQRIATTNRPQGKAYNMAFGEWLAKYKFDDMDKGDRSRLFQVIDNLGQIEEWRKTLTLTERLKLNHPNAVLRKWKAHMAPEPRTESGEPKPTLRDSVANLSEANDAKDRKIAQLEEHIAELEAARETTPAETETLAALRKQYVTRTTILTIPERRKELIALAHGMGFDIDIKDEPAAVTLAISGFKNKREGAQQAEPAAEWVKVEGYDNRWSLVRANVNYEIDGGRVRFRPGDAKRWKQFDYDYPTARAAKLAAEEHFRSTRKGGDTFHSKVL
jgi:hypothetical protein